MIDSNLAVLLAERNMKITKVAKDTGISRTTLTALCYDHTAGIKYETLNALCQYLDITPAEFFNYTPGDYEIQFLGRSKDEKEYHPAKYKTYYVYDVDICVTMKGVTWTYPEAVVVSVNDADPVFCNTVVSHELRVDADPTAANTAKQMIEQMRSTMTRRQKENMDNEVLRPVRKAYYDDYKNDTGVAVTMDIDDIFPISVEVVFKD